MEWIVEAEDIGKVKDGLITGRFTIKEQLVNCKDCKYYEIWQLKSDYTDDKRYKPSVCVVGRYAVHRSEDWFCADAERRTDEIN